MIVFLVWRGFHRPVAGQRRSTRADEWVAVGPRHVLEEIFRQELPVDFDAEPIGQLRDLDSLGKRCGWSLVGCETGRQGCRVSGAWRIRGLGNLS